MYVHSYVHWLISFVTNSQDERVTLGKIFVKTCVMNNDIDETGHY